MKNLNNNKQAIAQSNLYKNILRISVFVWFSLIWIVSSIPGDMMPQTDSLHFDKLAHAAIYLIFSILMYMNYNNGMFKKLTPHHLLLIMVFLASMDEAHQVFIKFRAVSAFDLSANLFGVFLGYFTVYTFKAKHDRIH